ncbi:alkaline phosphatase [Vibrio sp. B1Z05]|nr:alkaline phosphatase [Vibrio sp. B1Z05]
MDITQMKPSNSTLAISIAAALLLSGCQSESSSDEANDQVNKTKNVILMISDGASDGAWDIASFWQHGELLNDTYPFNELDTRYAMTTYALNGNSVPDESDSCDPDQYAEGFGYNPEKAADDTLIESDKVFAGYDYINTNYTDSAASGSAIATGQSTYNGGLAVNNCGVPQKQITEYAHEHGLSTGIISSVMFSHATPAAFAANNISRNNYHEIASSMLKNGHADLIIGSGHPLYDGDGQKLAEADYNFRYISEDDWNELQAGTLTSATSETPWTFIETKDSFDQLAQGIASDEIMNGPLLGIFQTGWTTQYNRTCEDESLRETAFACPELATVPDLGTMSVGALNYLSQNENGFFAMIEGGAVDWAAHGKDTAGIIEEQVDFHDAVKDVFDWVEANSNWEETLLIVTTDHGNAYVLGETSDSAIYAGVENPGAEKMPTVAYYSGSHTNELVRFYAKGNGADKFSEYVIGTDESYAERYRHTGATGDYFQNNHLFHAIKDIFEE